MKNSLQIHTVLDKQYAISQEDAEKLYPSLENFIKMDQEVYLSFQDIENCSSIFLNNLLGKLYSTYGERVDKIVHYVDINDDVLPNQLDRLRRRALSPDIYKPIFFNSIS
jgi:hypothetical protein